MHVAPVQFLSFLRFFGKKIKVFLPKARGCLRNSGSLAVRDCYFIFQDVLNLKRRTMPCGLFQTLSMHSARMLRTCVMSVTQEEGFRRVSDVLQSGHVWRNAPVSRSYMTFGDFQCSNYPRIIITGFMVIGLLWLANRKTGLPEC